MSMKEEFTAIDMATAAADGFRDGQRAAQPAPVVPEGYALVPVQMTDDMRDAGNIHVLNRGTLARIWADVLAAAPAQGQQVECQECERLRRSLDQAYANYNQVSFASTERGKERDRLGRELYERNNENYALRVQLSALKAQQVGQEPVGYTTAGMLAIAKELPLTGRIGARCKADERWNVPLYTTPQPALAQDVAGLVEAAKKADDALSALVRNDQPLETLTRKYGSDWSAAIDKVRTELVIRIADHDKQSGEG